MKDIYKKEGYSKEAIAFFDDEKIERMERIFKEFLSLVDNPYREGLKNTPKRMVKYWTEMLEGQALSNKQIAEMNDVCFEDEITRTQAKGLVVEKDIPIFSTCEHHTALMYDMKVNIAYIPNGKVIGLSKMGRIAEMAAKRLSLQEKIAQDIAEIMSIILGTNDVAVNIQGKHGCMTARGVKSREATTFYTYLSGAFFTNSDLRKEFETALLIK